LSDSPAWLGVKKDMQPHRGIIDSVTSVEWIDVAPALCGSRGCK